MQACCAFTDFDLNLHYVHAAICANATILSLARASGLHREGSFQNTVSPRQQAPLQHAGPVLALTRGPGPRSRIAGLPSAVTRAPTAVAIQMPCHGPNADVQGASGALV